MLTKKERPKTMKWLKRKIRKWLIEVNIESDYPVKAVYEENVIEEPILNFRIFSANNGKVLEFSSYDRVSDRRNRSLYIISKDEDIGEKVSKCLSLELLK